MSPTKKVKIAFVLLFIIFVTGTLGYHFIEGWTFAEAFYATVVTLGTVGYGDFYPITPEGRMFAVFLIIFGVGTMAYTFAMTMENFMEGRLRKVLGRGRLKRQIERMKGHYIICGCGKIGHFICRELAGEKVDFVVIDNDPEVIQKIEDEGFLYINGCATDDKILVEAGIKRARSIVSVLHTDADNLYVVLAARELNPDVYVLSRFEDEASERRLIKAGADRVISPHKVGGMRMTMALLRPAVLDFVEITVGKKSLALRMEEVQISESSHIAGKSLADSGLRQEYDLIIVAVHKKSGQMMLNPSANYVIEGGDNLVALGREENLLKLSTASQI